MAYYATGQQDKADAALNELIAMDHARTPYAIATVYAFENRSEQAFEWLDRALAQRAGDVIGTNVDPFLKSLHNDPRYTAFLKKIHLAN
jgi:tetratricopeptide (TPR) repeat protein